MRDGDGDRINSNSSTDLERLANSEVASVRLARRARIVLLAMRGCDCTTIARTLGIGRAQVARWLRRYEHGGLAAIAADRCRSGRRRRVSVESIVDRSMQPAPNGAGWSTRQLAAVCGVSDSTVWRALRERRDADVPQTARAARPPNELVVGIYLGADERAIASCRTDPHDPVQSSHMTPDAFGGCATTRDVTSVRANPDKVGLIDLEARSRTVSTSELTLIDFLDRVAAVCCIQRVVVDCDSARMLGRTAVKAWLANHRNIEVHVSASALAWRRRVDRLLHGGRDGNGDAPLYCHLMDTVIGYFSASRRSEIAFVWTWRSVDSRPVRAPLTAGRDWATSDASGSADQVRTRRGSLSANVDDHGATLS